MNSLGSEKPVMIIEASAVATKYGAQVGRLVGAGDGTGVGNGYGTGVGAGIGDRVGSPGGTVGIHVGRCVGFGVGCFVGASDMVGAGEGSNPVNSIIAMDAGMVVRDINAGLFVSS